MSEAAELINDALHVHCHIADIRDKSISTPDATVSPSDDTWANRKQDTVKRCLREKRSRQQTEKQKPG